MTNVPDYLLRRKAVEHHRTPKRKRNYRVRIGGHVLECGSVLPLFERTIHCCFAIAIAEFGVIPKAKQPRSVTSAVCYRLN